MFSDSLDCSYFVQTQSGSTFLGDTMLRKWDLGLFANHLGSTDRRFQGMKMHFTTFAVISLYYHCFEFSIKSFGRRFGKQFC